MGKGVHQDGSKQRHRVHVGCSYAPHPVKSEREEGISTEPFAAPVLTTPSLIHWEGHTAHLQVPWQSLMFPLLTQRPVSCEEARI